MATKNGITALTAMIEAPQQPVLVGVVKTG